MRLLNGRMWLTLFLVGALLWIAATAVTAITEDTILVPTVILLGSFLIPVTMVLFALSRGGGTELPAQAIATGFLIAGLFGVVFSAFAETYLLRSPHGEFLGVGVIEEGTKALVLAAVARTVTSRRPRDGLVLGATVGAGFAAFESAGYALSAVVGHGDDHPIARIVATEAQRAVLAPFGHITWTALMGGAIFAAAGANGSLRFTRGVLWTFVGVSVLHALWDGTYGLAILIAEGVEGDGWTFTWPDAETWVGEPTGGRLIVFQVAYDVLIVLNAAIGASWVVRRWRRYGAADAPLPRV